MTDIYVFKYSKTLPQHLMTFMISRNMVGNEDMLPGKPIVTVPRRQFGPDKCYSDELFYENTTQTSCFMS